MKIFFFSLLISSISWAQAPSAVQALRQHLPHWDYVGSDEHGEKCELDFYGRTDGSLMADMWASGHQQFLVKPDMRHETRADAFVVEAPAVREGQGVAVMSLIVRPGPEVSIQRSYTSGGRTWVSAMTCQLN